MGAEKTCRKVQQFLLSCVNVIPSGSTYKTMRHGNNGNGNDGGTNKQPDEELVGLQNYDP